MRRQASHKSPSSRKLSRLETSEHPLVSTTLCECPAALQSPDILTVFLSFVAQRPRLLVAALVCHRWRKAAARTVFSVKVSFRSNFEGVDVSFLHYPHLRELNLQTDGYSPQIIVVPTAVRSLTFGASEDCLCAEFTHLTNLHTLAYSYHAAPRYSDDPLHSINLIYLNSQSLTSLDIAAPFSPEMQVTFCSNLTDLVVSSEYELGSEFVKLHRSQLRSLSIVGDLNSVLPGDEENALPQLTSLHLKRAFIDETELQRLRRMVPKLIDLHTTDSWSPDEAAGTTILSRLLPLLHSNAMAQSLEQCEGLTKSTRLQDLYITSQTQPLLAFNAAHPYVTRLTIHDVCSTPLQLSTHLTSLTELRLSAGDQFTSVDLLPVAHTLRLLELDLRWESGQSKIEEFLNYVMDTCLHVTRLTLWSFACGATEEQLTRLLRRMEHQSAIRQVRLTGALVEKHRKDHRWLDICITPKAIE